MRTAKRSVSSLDTHDEIDGPLFRNYVQAKGIYAEAELSETSYTGKVIANTDMETLIQLYQDWRKKNPVAVGATWDHNAQAYR